MYLNRFVRTHSLFIFIFLLAMTVAELGLLLTPSDSFLVFALFQLFMTWIVHQLLVLLRNFSLVLLLLSHRCLDLLLHLLHLSCLLLRQILINFLDSARVDTWTPLSMRRHGPFATIYLWSTIRPIQINLLVVVIVYSTACSLIFQKAFFRGLSTSTRNVPAKGV